MLRIRSVIKADLGQHSFGHALGTIYLIYMYVYILTIYFIYSQFTWLCRTPFASFFTRQFPWVVNSILMPASRKSHTMWAHPQLNAQPHTCWHTHTQTHPFLHLLTLTYTFNSWSRASAQWTRPACTLPAPAASPFPLPLLGNYPHIFWPQVEPFPISFDFKSNFWARSAKNNWMRLSR